MNSLLIGNIDIEVISKDIKNIHLSVHPPHGRVRLATPEKMNDESVRLFAISKLSWIKTQKKKFENQERETLREFVSGESHYFLGDRYLLNVVNTRSKQRVEIANNSYVNLYSREDSTKIKRENIMNEWYRSELKKVIPGYIKKWEKIMDVCVDGWNVRKMKTKWGSCNIGKRKILLNLELAKKNPRCIEYVIVHEMVHLLERNDNDKFKAYMDKFLPNWRAFRNEINGIA